MSSTLTEIIDKGIDEIVLRLDVHKLLPPEEDKKRLMILIIHGQMLNTALDLTSTLTEQTVMAIGARLDPERVETEEPSPTPKM